MQRSHVFRSLLSLSLSLVLWHMAVASAAETRLLVVAPCTTHAPLPSLGLGLQQVLLDDLQGLFPQRIMPREDLRSLLAARPNAANTPFYLSDIPALSPQLKTRLVLSCVLRVQEGTVTWHATLARGTTGAAVQTWTLTGSLERLWSLKGQMVAAVTEQLPASERQGTLPKAEPGTEATLASLGAFGRGLAALDRQDYALAVREWRQALQYEATFRYATTQLERFRTLARTTPLTPRDQGLWLLADAQLEPAETALQEAVRVNAKDSEAWRALGQIALARKDTKTARQHAAKARELEPAQAPTWVLLGQIAQAEGKDTEARDLAQKARDLAPTQVEPRLLLADSHAKLREPEKAKQEYVQGSALATTALRLPEARSMVAAAKQAAPQAPEPLIGEGDLLAHLGQPRSALTAYTQAQPLAPKNATIAQKVGTMQRQLGDMQAAVSQYQHALSLSNDDFDANLQLGQLYLDRHDYTRAAPYLEKARQLQPGRAEVQKLLGRLYHSTGKKDAAVQAYRTALRGGANDAETYQAYGDALTAQGNVAEAVAQYTQATKRDPDAVSAHSRLWKAQSALGKQAEATAAQERVKLLTPELGTATPGSSTPLRFQPEMAELLASFAPGRTGNGPVPVAVVPLETLLPQPGRLARLWDAVSTFMTLRQVETAPLRQAFEAALEPTYRAVPSAKVMPVLRSPLYKTMGPEHLTNVVYLEELCEALEVRALLFYAVQQDGLSKQGSYNVTVRAILFEKGTKQTLTNEAQLDVPKAHLTTLNLPFMATLLAGMLLGGGVLGNRHLRGVGKLVVQIHQANEERKAFFSVLVSKKGNKDLAKTKHNLLKVVKTSVKGGKYERDVRHSVYERSMVFDTTTFPKLRAGTYYVYLFGVIADAEGEDVGNYQMQQKVTIQKQQSHTLAFDLRPQTSRARIQVLNGQEAALGAEITIRGLGESRYLREAKGVLFRLPVGTYTCVVQYDGKFFTQDIEIPALAQDFRFTFTVPTEVPVV